MKKTLLIEKKEKKVDGITIFTLEKLTHKRQLFFSPLALSWFSSFWKMKYLFNFNCGKNENNNPPSSVPFNYCFPYFLLPPRGVFADRESFVRTFLRPRSK
jgi:hypothetical protein